MGRRVGESAPELMGMKTLLNDIKKSLPLLIIGSIVFAQGLMPVRAYAQTAIPACPAGAVYTDTDTTTGQTFYYPSALARAGTLIGINNQCQPSQAQLDQIQQALNSCSLTGAGGWNFTNCFWNPLLLNLGNFLLTVGAAALQFAGMLFDTLVYYVIVAFGSTLSSLGLLNGTTGAITIGWDVFRDLSNILIIGMFVFIAISTILGSKEYGYKRLVARVLIIAVLMNFSLLFTKLIIDGSNFTAFQFYNQMAGQQATGTTTGTQQYDIAAAFLKPLGITSVFNTKAAITGFTQGTQTGASAGFMFGLVGFILLIAIAAVLFYGVVLIGTRAVILIFLLLTASVAFATYLIPNFASNKFGWKGWWEALINCAIFAPLLMLFLSLSLLIINNAPSAGSTNTLGTIISNPSNLASGWQIMMTYLLAIGLLFVSMKISSQFASGTNVLNAIASAASGSLTGVAGFTARNTFGRAGMLMANVRGNQAKDAQLKATRAEGRAAAHEKAGDAAAANIAKNEALQYRNLAAKRQASAARYTGVAEQKFGGKTSVASKIEERGKAAAKVAEKFGLSESDKDKLRQQAAQEVTQMRASGLKEVTDKKADADTIAEAIKAAADERKAPVKQQYEAAVTEQKKITDDAEGRKIEIGTKYDPESARLRREITEKTAANDQAEVDRLKVAQQRHESERRAALDHEENRIKEAAKKTGDLKQQLDVIDTQKLDIPVEVTLRDGTKKRVSDSLNEVVAAAVKAGKEVDKFQTETANKAKVAGDAIIQSYSHGIAETAGVIARRQGTWTTRAAGFITGDNTRAEKAGVKEFKKHHSKEARLKDVLKEVAIDDGDAHAGERKIGG